MELIPDEHHIHHRHLIGTTVECECGLYMGITTVAFSSDYDPDIIFCAACGKQAASFLPSPEKYIAMNQELHHHTDCAITLWSYKSDISPKPECTCKEVQNGAQTASGDSPQRAP